MSTHTIIHRVAILSLLVVAAMSIIGSMDQVPGAPMEMRLAPFLATAMWSLFLWKIWKRPRQWGLGLGIFLFFAIAFQSYLWWSSFNNPEINKLNLDTSVTRFILLYELPIFVAGVSCTLLRFYDDPEGITEGSQGAKAP